MGEWNLELVERGGDPYWHSLPTQVTLEIPGKLIRALHLLRGFYCSALLGKLKQ